MRRVTEQEKAEYKRLLTTRRGMRKPPPIPNRYPWQGELAILELLDIAKSKQEQGENVEIRILTGSAPDRVYGLEAPKLWKEFLDRGGDIRVLAWTDSEDRCGDVMRKLSRTCENLEFRLSGTNEFAQSIRHFVVVGDEDCRLEAPHEPFDEDIEFSDYDPEIPARTSFKDPRAAALLTDYFDRFWEHCRPLSSQ